MQLRSSVAAAGAAGLAIVATGATRSARRARNIGYDRAQELHMGRTYAYFQHFDRRSRQGEPGPALFDGVLSRGADRGRRARAGPEPALDRSGPARRSAKPGA